MKRRKLLETLSRMMGKEKKGKLKHHDELKKLLKQIKEKEIQLEQKMLKEKDKRKRKHLQRELDIVRAQYAKGLEKLGSLDVS
jgi:hypothetical protein